MSGGRVGLAQQLANLHDETLLSIELLWREGTAQLRLRGVNGDHRIEVDEVTHVDCPRALSWGPSVSINTATVTAASPTAIQFTLEMQTGDALTISGRSITFLGP